MATNSSSPRPHLLQRLGHAWLEEPSPSWQRYGAAVVAVCAAFGLRVACDPLLGGRGTYGFFLIATAVINWRCGLGPSLLVLAAGTLIGAFYFEWPQHGNPFASSESFVPLLMTLTIGIVTVVVCESLRRMALDNARLYREARLADRRKDEFLAMLAHELRNPLAPIRNALYVLDRLEGQAGEAQDLQRMIAGQTDHLVHLVDDLLDVARITRGKIELRPAETQLGPIVEAAVTAVRPLIDEKRHELHVSLPNVETYLLADSVRLTQVLSNLLNNAAKYTDAAGRIWLTVEQDRENNVVTIRVRDTGVGLTAEQAGRIFNLFEQADASIEKSRGGLGIGLTLARDLVQMHGGTLEVNSQGMGQGSEFVVRLPMLPSRVEPVAAPRRHPAPRADGGLRVLVVEDVVASAGSLATILRLWGHEVEICYDGFAAVERARAFGPDVVLTDLGLPRMNGYGLAEELRRDAPDGGPMLVAISGYGQSRDRERSQQAGFAHHLTKPIDPDELKEILDGFSSGTTVGAASP